MTEISIQSAGEPYDSHPRALGAAVRLVAVAEATGQLPAGRISVLDHPLIVEIAAGFSQAGVGQHGFARLRGAGLDADEVTTALEEVLAGVEDSPMPDGEWRSLSVLLGDELLGRLLHISASSIRRYTSESRKTPDLVAARLHVLALVVADLLGGYNEFGVRRWFLRPRSVLDGKTPAVLLGNDWDPDGREALRLRGLAAELTGAGAT